LPPAPLLFLLAKEEKEAKRRTAKVIEKHKIKEKTAREEKSPAVFL
jgi:hypothetical protein